MNRKNILAYAAALAVCFVIGCGAALLLRAIDEQDAHPVPLSDGQTLSFSGFTLIVPYDAVIVDDASPSADVLYTGHILWEDHTLSLFCRINEEGDALTDYSDQALITQFTALGALEPRLRTLGGLRFIQYAVMSEDETSSARINRFETWDATLHIRFETSADVTDVLPILATLSTAP